MKYVNLDFVVRSYMNKRGDDSMHGYARYLQLAFGVARDELSCILPHYVKSCMLTVNGNRTADLPLDFVSYTKIGVAVNGRLELLSIAPNQPFAQTFDDCGSLESPSIAEDNGTLDIEEPDIAFYNYSQGGYFGTMFGYQRTSSAYGNFRFRFERNQIQFDDRLPDTEVYLEYKCNSLSSAGQAIIPVEAIPALETGIYHESVKFKRTAPISEKREAERLHKEAIRNMRLKVFKFTVKDFKDVMRNAYGQTPKN
jgi:hypothetical protein